MKSNNLYETEPYLKAVDVTVLDSRYKDGLYWHKFDRTIIYPGGGGQLPDEGMIDELPIVTVMKEDDIVWHGLKKQLSGTVHLRLNWDARISRMQQHTGQHILSAVFQNEFGYETVSVHLGQNDTLIELQAEHIAQEILTAVEHKANAVIRDHLPVNVDLVEESELANYTLRRDLKVSDFPARLISIGDYDCTGCGGTHVQNSAEVGLIKIIGAEKIRGRVRIKAWIGNRAYDYFTETYQSAKAAADELSVKITELPNRISALEDERKTLNSRIKKITKEWLDLLLRFIEPAGDENYLIYSNEDFSDEQARQFSSAWVIENQQILFLIYDKSAQKFVMRIPQSVSFDAGTWIRSTGNEIGLKGGGKGDFIQGVLKKDQFKMENLKVALAKIE